MDNYATHKTLEVRDWLDKHPRIQVHFTPTSGLLRLTPDSGQVVVWSGGLGSRLVGLSGQVVFVL